MAGTANAKTPGSGSQLRKHYFLDSYVIIAPGRTLRPDSFAKNAEPHIVDSDHCPFDDVIHFSQRRRRPLAFQDLEVVAVKTTLAD